MSDITVETDIAIACEAWLERVPALEEILKELAVRVMSRVLRSQGVRDGISYEISILMTDDDAIHELNRDYRGKDKPTNVLSFPQTNEQERECWVLPIMNLGDIVMAYETIAREADEQRKDFHDHMRHMMVHGILHLLGYDHETEAEASVMEALEIEILAAMGIKNPYDAQQYVA